VAQQSAAPLLRGLHLQSEIYIDLNVGESDTIVTTDITELPESTFIRLTDLLYGSLTTLAAFPQEHHAKLDEYKRRIEAYDFSIIEVRNVPIDVATEIFTRINVGGKPLTVFEIMVAKTYDEKQGFDLSEKYSVEILICVLPKINLRRQRPRHATGLFADAGYYFTLP
jgi:hypothetical protein